MTDQTPPVDEMDYETMTHEALRTVIRDGLLRAAEGGIAEYVVENVLRSLGRSEWHRAPFYTAQGSPNSA